MEELQNMDLGGNLGVFEPAMLFQFIELSMLTGKLELVNEKKGASFYFSRGILIYAAISSNRKRVGELLMENGKIDSKQLKKALKVYRKEKIGRRIGQILIDCGYIDRESLVSVMQEQMKEIVYEVISWKEGEFAFIRDVEPEGEDILLDVQMNHLLLEGCKRIDEDEWSPVNA